MLGRLHSISGVRLGSSFWPNDKRKTSCQTNLWYISCSRSPQRFRLILDFGWNLFAELILLLCPTSFTLFRFLAQEFPSQALLWVNLMPVRYTDLWSTSSERKGNVLVAQLCQILCDPMDGSPLGSSVHGLLQARILEWVTIPFSRGLCLLSDQTCVSRIAGRFFIVWATREATKHLKVRVKPALREEEMPDVWEEIVHDMLTAMLGGSNPFPLILLLHLLLYYSLVGN